ncbi:hypothetical protein [Nostoc sp. DSM 114167]|jgi:hypothetical protein|uniref:hypothetical protein n=1 Tax=Nostoc sp. DSM 114167 TaxID=3439050 RepID=UPI004045B9CE
MSYHLIFALNLEQQGSQIFYNPEAFVGNPVVISVPEVKKLIDYLIPKLKLVAVVEKEAAKITSKGKKPSTDKTKISESNLDSEQDKSQTNIFLREVTAEAYVGKVKDLDKIYLEELCTGIATYLTNNVSKISAETLLSMEINPIFSGLREIIDLRNYLLNFVKNPNDKKKYREGYIYIMNV